LDKFVLISEKSQDYLYKKACL